MPLEDKAKIFMFQEIRAKEFKAVLKFGWVMVFFPLKWDPNLIGF